MEEQGQYGTKNKKGGYKGKPGSQGFSLIEVLISFALVTWLILGISQLIIHSLSIKRRSDDSVKSAELASSKLEHFKSLPFESSELFEGVGEESLKGYEPKKFFRREWSIEAASPNLKKIIMNCFSEICPEKKTRLVLYLSKELGF